MTTSSLSSLRSAPKLPLWLKISFSTFMAVLVPVYWVLYGATNFLYFCDIALFLMLIAVWKESRFLASMAAVGLLLPQALWIVDYLVVLAGGTFTGMTNYMLDAKRPVFLRGLSLFHLWLPLMIAFAVHRLGYDRRAFRAWSTLAVVLCTVAYTLLPAPGAAGLSPLEPSNVNYVFGFSETEPQHWMHPHAFFGAWVLGLIGVVYWPTHQLLMRWKR
jgi:hypothetical protein